MQKRIVAMIIAAMGVASLLVLWQPLSFGHPSPEGNTTSEVSHTKQLKAMPLKQKVAQLLFVGVTSRPMADTLAHYHIGGYLLRPESGMFSSQATSAVTKISNDAPLFAIDEEGGLVSRLPGAPFSQDSAAVMGTLSDNQVENIGFQIGKRLRAIGANIDFAPVADLDDGSNAAISALQRSFSSDPTVVADKAAAFARGLQKAGVVPTFKHFPGLGRATGQTFGNTDAGPATTPSFASLKARDLIPYESLLSPTTTAMVMVGNQIVPGLTENKPASLSPATYRLLRSTYGFGQVTVTDELLLAKAVSNVEPDASRAVISALQAGADMPLIDPENAAEVEAIITSVAAAVKDGRLSETTINQALERVLTLKSYLADHS